MGETGSGIQVRYSVSVNRECVFFDDISRILFRSCQLLILCFFFSNAVKCSNKQKRLLIDELRNKINL